MAHRLDEFDECLRPVLSQFLELSLLITVDGSPEPNAVNRSVLEALERQAGASHVKRAQTVR